MSCRQQSVFIIIQFDSKIREMGRIIKYDYINQWHCFSLRELKLCVSLMAQCHQDKLGFAGSEVIIYQYVNLGSIKRLLEVHVPLVPISIVLTI